MRYSLLSYLAAFLVLSGIVGANLVPQTRTDLYGSLLVSLDDGRQTIGDRQEIYGWPWPGLQADWCWLPGDEVKQVVVSTRWLQIGGDIIVAATCTLAALVCCEVALRRFHSTTTHRCSCGRDQCVPPPRL